ncbi:MAG: hypothetical protein JW838_00350 [Spirochaetes bacterium]|nr:hypothetical protein [Spirochaetota bacterium]
MRAALLSLLLSMPLLAAPAAEPGTPEISASVKPAKGTVGSLIEYRVFITGKGVPALSVAPPEHREFFPPPEPGRGKKPGTTGNDDEGEVDPASLVPLYVIHSVKKDDRSGKGMTDITVTVQMAYYRPGTWALPDIEIKGEDGILLGYRAPEVEIAPSNKEGEFQEIEPPMDLGGNYLRLVLLLLGIAVLGVLAFFIGRHLRKRILERRQAPVIIPPLETFMKEVGELRGEELIEGGRIEEFVLGISMIFRAFLSAQFGFDATEMTSHEIERKIRKAFPRDLHARCHADIMENLNLWDLSKFAEFTPSKERLRGSLAKTVELARILSREEGDGLPGV